MYSHGQVTNSKGTKDTLSKFSKLVISGVTRDELGNLLAKFKISFLVLRLQLDTLKLKKNHDEENATLSIFYSKCRK